MVLSAHESAVQANARMKNSLSAKPTGRSACNFRLGAYRRLSYLELPDFRTNWKVDWSRLRWYLGPAPRGPTVSPSWPAPASRGSRRTSS